MLGVSHRADVLHYQSSYYLASRGTMEMTATTLPKGTAAATNAGNNNNNNGGGSGGSGGRGSPTSNNHTTNNNMTIDSATTDYIRFPDAADGGEVKDDATSAMSSNSILPSWPWSKPQNSATNTRNNNTTITRIVTACYIALAAMLGCLLRMGMAQLFGDACANPDSVGWLRAAAPLCVTKDGTTQQQGGIIFSDLPANLLGCFIMGLLQDSVVLGLALRPMGVAWMTPDHSFQRATVWHTALKTGFCGSLTTFSSWNSEMVVMLFGTDRSRHTQLWSALFGYIVGMETSLGSFAAGCSLARRLHRWVNPVLAAEKRVAWQRILQGVALHPELPDLERRFLADLPTDPERLLQRAREADGETTTTTTQSPLSSRLCNNTDAGATAETQAAMITEAKDEETEWADLERWKASTDSVRRVGHELLAPLQTVERAILLQHVAVPPDALRVAVEEDWDVASLQAHVSINHTRDDALLLPQSQQPQPESRIWMKLPFAVSLFAMAVALLITGLFLDHAPTAAATTNRTMIFAMLFAPFGALLRWHLSKWNNRVDVISRILPVTWTWLPVGTLSANVLGSIVSIVGVAIEYRLESNSSFDATNFWAVGTIRAAKVGFAGCLTTVSTFVSEVSGFMNGKTEYAYPYILVTLGTSCAVACSVFGIIVKLA